MTPVAREAPLKGSRLHDARCTGVGPIPSADLDARDKGVGPMAPVGGPMTPVERESAP